MEILKNKIKIILMEKYNLNNEEVENTVVDMVEREFLTTGIPKNEELENYIDEYMDRQEEEQWKMIE